jgi:head-tail adaptor
VASRLGIRNVGTLDKRVTLWRPADSGADVYGTPKVEFAPYSTVWARIEPEPFLGRTAETISGLIPQIVADTTHRITIRFVRQLDSSWRVTRNEPGVITKRNADGTWAPRPDFEGFIEILAVQDRNEDHEVMTLLCRERM